MQYVMQYVQSKARRAGHLLCVYYNAVSNHFVISEARRAGHLSPHGTLVITPSESVMHYTVRSTYGTPEADPRTVYVPWGTGCPVPPVRDARRRPVRVARTCSAEAPGRTCQPSWSRAR